MIFFGAILKNIYKYAIYNLCYGVICNYVYNNEIRFAGIVCCISQKVNIFQWRLKINYLKISAA